MGEVWAVARSLAAREVRGRYRQSALGWVWAGVTPLVSALAFWAVQSARWIEVGSTEVPYPVFAFTGLWIWQGAYAGVSRGTASLVSARDVALGVRVPHEAFALAAVLSVCVDVAVGGVVWAGVCWGWGVSWSGAVWGVPLVWGVVLAWVLGVSWILSVLQAAARDVGAALPLLGGAGLVLTPVVYPIADAAWWVWLNPMAGAITAARDLAFVGRLSAPWALAGAGVGGLLVCAVGRRWVRLAGPRAAVVL